MRTVESWDTLANFWEVNPQLKVPAVFNKLYVEDKSKNKAHSSKLMWAIAYYADFDSKYRALSDGERQKLVAEDILKDPEFNWEQVSSYIKAWDMFKTVPMKQMTEWERLMNEKTEYMKTLKYNSDTADEIEKRLLSNSKLYSEYEEIMSRLVQDGEGGTMLGGAMESLTEKGEI
jgi:DNA repair ATPase RecN